MPLHRIRLLRGRYWEAVFARTQDPMAVWTRALLAILIIICAFSFERRVISTIIRHANNSFIFPVSGIRKEKEKNEEVQAGQKQLNYSPRRSAWQRVSDWQCWGAGCGMGTPQRIPLLVSDIKSLVFKRLCLEMPDHLGADCSSSQQHVSSVSHCCGCEDEEGGGAQGRRAASVL